MSAERYLSSSQQAAIAVYVALHERPLIGKTPVELARQCGLTRDQAYRALCNWARQGFVEQPRGRGSAWRLTPKAAALSECMRDALMARHLGGHPEEPHERPRLTAVR